METTLNLVWVGVVIAGLLVWRFHLSVRWQESEGYLRQSQRFMALCVVLFLLFPVISLSDDLQQAAGLVEDAGAGYRKASKGKFSASDTRSHTPALSIGCTEFHPIGLPSVFTGCLLPEIGLLLPDALQGAHQGRAPPFTKL
jgi:hypothetical protein